MPCWTVQQNRVKLEIADLEIMQRGLEAQGIVVRKRSASMIEFEMNNARVNMTKGESGVEVRSYGQIDEKAIKRAYSGEIVRTTAQRFGWSVEEREVNGQTEFVTTRAF